MKKMQAPQSRDDFEHNINLLIEEGFSIDDAPEDVQRSFFIFTYPSLKDVRYLPNGRIDLNTVDESLRLNANTRNHLRSMSPFKDTPED